MKQNIWTNTFLVTSFLVEARRFLSLSGLLSLMQEMAWAHASHLGHGYQSTRESGESWVVARQSLEMKRWPKWGEEVTVSTWLRPPGAVIVTRDFTFSVGSEQVGKAAAHWLTIDHKTRRPTRIPFPDDPTYFRDHGILNLEPGKLAPQEGLQPLAEFVVRYGDLDMNGHVNNIRFAQWIVDTFPLETALKLKIIGYETNFLAEARPADRIMVSGYGNSDPATQRAYQGRRSSDEKLLFTARLGVTPT